MLKIHKSHSKKLLVIPITSILSICTLLGISYLTYTPELSHAESITYEPPKETRTMADITYMQDITPEICANTKEADTAGNNQYQLKDSRDQKTYWVAKLKDGNCWMTQNLDLDLYSYVDDAGVKLTSDDTDLPINEQWISATGPSKLWNASGPASIMAYYDPGEYIYDTPTSQSSCGAGTADIKSCPNISPVAGLSNDSTGDTRAHYSVGNYYSFNAATAGFGSKVAADSNVGSSICPKGWTLPSSGPNNTSSGSYKYLLDKYGLSYSLSFGKYDIRRSPLYFVYSGYFGNYYNGQYGYYGMVGVGERGRFWSSSINSVAVSGQVYDLSIDMTISINGANNRYYGDVIRCVARMDPLPNNNVDIVVNPTISLDVANEVKIEKTETNPSTASLDVKVSSNQKYSVGISANDPNLTSTTSNVTIPAKSGLLNTSEDGWGIKLNDDTNYTALTTSLQTFYAASGAEIKTIPFTIGISTAPDIPNGEYSTNITITATQN